MDRDRRYGWGNEDRGRDEERGGRGFGSRDRDDDWRQRGGYFGGRERDDEQRMSRGSYAESREDDWRGGRDRDFGMSGQAGRGTEGGGWSSREWERDRDRYESSRSSGYGQMGLGNQGGWGSSHGLGGGQQGGYGPQGRYAQQGGYGTQGGYGYSQSGSQGGGYGGSRETSREAGPYGASPSSYGGGMPGYGSGTSGYDTTRYGTSGRGAGAYTAGGWPYSQSSSGAPSGYGTGMRGNLGAGSYGTSGAYGQGSYGQGMSGPSTGREWERERGGWDRDRTGGWEVDEAHEGGGMLHRMGEGIRHMLGGERGERGPFFGRGPKGYKRSDERVREEVCEVIARQGYIDASEVEVRVQGGEVTLSGQVRDREQKRRLEQMIEDLPGVDDVKNEIRVVRMETTQPGRGMAGATATGAPTGNAPSVTTTSSEDNGTRGGRTRTS